MKGYRFYLEYPNPQAKRRSGKGAGVTHAGNVVAVFLNEHNNPIYYPSTNGVRDITCVEAEGGIYNYPNSPVCGAGPSREYLRDYCKRVPEAVARQIHPELFKVLDDWEKE